MTKAEDAGVARPRWARRVRQDLVRRLYESDARGLRDEELADEAGMGLYARCLSMIEASEAAEGKVLCPACKTAILHDRQDETILECVACEWQMPWLEYRKTFQKKKLAAPGILDPLRQFASQYATCRSYETKLIAIDTLLHTFHAQARKWPTSPIAKNVLQGNIQEIVAFLDGLAYGNGSTTGLLASRHSYQATLARSWAGGAKRPKDWREPAEGG